VNAWGDESKKWVDKKVKVELVKQNVRGELKVVVYGHPMAEELPGTVEARPKMTRAEALEKVKNWPKEDAETYLKYLEDSGQIPKS
jgi:4-hydroxy-3-methylbut-2-enyl diphosphate reductase IspH